jgi:cell division protein FtsZ
VLKDGGVAIMSTGFGEGEKRVTKAIEEALNSPLLNNNDIYNSKKILLNVNFCRDEEQAELTMEEMNEIDEFMSKFREDVETKWGLATDSSLGNKVKITLLATGFGLGDISRDRIEPTSITSRKTQAEMEDEKNRYEERMRKFYGKDKDSNNIRRNHHVFIFSEENIDNEDVISMVENLPTYNRTKEGLKSITTKSAGLETVETEEDNINFNLKG